MSFIDKLLPTKKIAIIDIGTYQVKTAICEQKDGDFNIVGYGEKRQEINDIIHGEIGDIEGVCETIESALIKASLDSEINPKDIIINIPTQSIISEINKINYKREDKNSLINLSELDEIIGKVENISLEKAKKAIQEKTGYQDIDMKLIVSSITKISIDGQQVTNPLDFTGENISISTLNIFIPLSKYNLIQTIGTYLNKNIVSIVPLEFSIPKLAEYTSLSYEDVIFVDIGNTKTTIIIQKSGSIVGFNRIDIGTRDLIKIISEKNSDITANIIKKLDDNKNYVEEKKAFFELWKEGFLIALSDILGEDTIPYKLFISGGGNNSFMKEYLENISLASEGIKSIKEKFVIIDNKILNELSYIKNDILKDKTNINLLSQVICAKEIISMKKDPVREILKKVIKRIEK
ncbi:MAG: hypothetical protein PHR68_00995 [Candidatus Gracilibacteria bacterium]|nr:hypothetical protein [Candidatus Gracilibacteria bacterium]